MELMIRFLGEYVLIRPMRKSIVMESCRDLRAMRKFEDVFTSLDTIQVGR